jgi:hypothetical protein
MNEVAHGWQPLPGGIFALLVGILTLFRVPGAITDRQGATGAGYDIDFIAFTNCADRPARGGTALAFYAREVAAGGARPMKTNQSQPEMILAMVFGRIGDDSPGAGVLARRRRRLLRMARQNLYPAVEADRGGEEG